MGLFGTGSKTTAGNKTYDAWKVKAAKKGSKTAAATVKKVKRSV